LLNGYFPLKIVEKWNFFSFCGYFPKVQHTRALVPLLKNITHLAVYVLIAQAQANVFVLFKMSHFFDSIYRKEDNTEKARQLQQEKDYLS
jgi:hypothetical protein